MNAQTRSDQEIGPALRHAQRWLAMLCLACGSGLPALAATQSLADLSLEELSTMEITSVSRRAERLSDAAASVYVITHEAIRRAGITTLPDALRLAPNLQVAQVSASDYAITARGFNNSSALGNKLLVLIDGRTVYTPFLSGVFWDQQDVLLEDVERIEVISGPGATLWGANAVNGVINVITRAAGETQGALVQAAVGTGGAHVAVRQGGSLGENGHYRLYAKQSQLQNTRTAAGTAVSDGWDRRQVGFRGDWSAGRDRFTLQGEAFSGASERRSAAFGAIEASGSNLLARWTRQLSDTSNLRVQAYLDHVERDDPLLYRPTLDIADLEWQHALQVQTHKLVWGGGYRRSHDDIRPGFLFAFVPASTTQTWRNLFLQDSVALSPALELTLGAKLESNDYTGTEKLPSARLAWKLDDDRLLWAALSRAVRAPARLDRDLRLPANPPYFIAGGPNFVSEVANVAEVGWRAQANAVLSYSATLFYTHWDRLRSGQLPPNALVQNMMEGSTYGLETWGAWQVTPTWRLNAGWTWLQERLHLAQGSTDPDGFSDLGNDPQFQWNLRSSFELAPGQELDIGLRRIAALPNPTVKAYTALDLRYGWRLRPGLSVAVVGQNLLDPSHAEFGAAPGRSEIARNLMVQLTWAF
ncbi:MAG: TonB-dependent receptor [Burkholderiales bacterium]